MQRPPLADIALASAAAAALSGLPSTAWALATGDEPLRAARAAGTLLPGRDEPSLLGGVVAHIGVSALWGTMLALVLPARRPVQATFLGAAAGLAIAAVDLGVIGRRYPHIRALPLGPQLADHAAFGAIVGAVISRGSARAG